MVEVAEGFGTYVTAHVYTVDGIRQAIENGVKSIEQGNLIDEEFAQMMAEKGVWLSPQVVVYLTFSPDLGPAGSPRGRWSRKGSTRCSGWQGNTGSRSPLARTSL